MDFRLWLEEDQENDDRPSVMVLYMWDNSPGAHGAGGDYDSISPQQYAQHLGVSVDDLKKDYSGDWDWDGSDLTRGMKSLPNIEGHHYGYESHITPKADHMLIGNEAYIVPEQYLGYAHSHENSAEVVVIVKPEQVEDLKSLLKPGEYYAGKIIPAKEQRSDFSKEAQEDDPYDSQQPVQEFKWDGLTNVIKRIAKRQEMTPPASLYSKKWSYTAGIDPKSPKLFPGPAKPRAKDPRETTARKPGETSADWLLRAVKEMKQRRDAEERKLGGNWE